MEKSSGPLVIFGDQDFAQLACEYFSADSAYEVAGFAVDGAYRRQDTLCGLPLVAFEDMESRFPPATHSVYVAVVYGRLNRLREEICARVRAKGYRLASYISSRASVWRNARFGEHCFVFEDNTVQPFVTVGDDVVLWSGNHIGHHSRIGDHCFVTSQVVVSGWCDIGRYCFLGVNATLANNTRVGERCWVSHGAILSGDIPAGSLVKSVASEVTPLNEAVLFRSLARASRARER